jgi:aconitase B
MINSHHQYYTILFIIMLYDHSHHRQQHPYVALCCCGDLHANCVNLPLNFLNQLGKGADVFLASDELAAVAAIEGNVVVD